jgi:hypothetical protein
MHDECPTRPQQTCIFIELNDFADIEVRLQVEKLVMMRCTTFYETAVRQQRCPCAAPRETWALILAAALSPVTLREDKCSAGVAQMQHDIWGGGRRRLADASISRY